MICSSTIVAFNRFIDYEIEKVQNYGNTITTYITLQT